MGEPSDAGAAPLRSSVVSLTNGPSIMILGRLGVFSTRTVAPDPIRVARETRSLCMIPLASTLGIYLGTSRCPGSLPVTGSHRREDVNGVATQGNEMLSLGEAESPLPGQVYVTPQTTCGRPASAP